MRQVPRQPANSSTGSVAQQIGGARLGQAAAVAVRLQAGGHDDIPGLYPVMGGAFQGDIDPGADWLMAEAVVFS